MSSYNTWISIGSIIQDYINKSAHDGNLNDELIYIAAEEAVDQIITGDNFCEYVMLIDLYNQKGELPSNFKYPNHVAYRPPETDDCTKSNDLRRYFIKSINNNCIEDIVLDACTKCKQQTCCCEIKQWYPIESNQDYVKLMKTPQLASGYSKFMYGVQDRIVNNKTQVLSELSHVLLSNDSKPLHEKKIFRNYVLPCFSKASKCPEFQMVRPKSNYYFNLPNIIKKCNVPCYDTNLEYDIKDGIITINNYDYKCNQCKGCNEKTSCYLNYPIEPQGQVLISYLGSKIDEEGFLMIPNTPYSIKAVTDYIVAYMARIDYASKQDNKSKDYFLTMNQLSEISLIKARAKLRIPSPDKWDHFIKNIVIKENKYTDYQENLNRWQLEDYQLPEQSYQHRYNEGGSYPYNSF